MSSCVDSVPNILLATVHFLLPFLGAHSAADGGASNTSTSLSWWLQTAEALNACLQQASRAACLPLLSTEAQYTAANIVGFSAPLLIASLPLTGRSVDSDRARRLVELISEAYGPRAQAAKESTFLAPQHDGRVYCVGHRAAARFASMVWANTSKRLGSH